MNWVVIVLPLLLSAALHGRAKSLEEIPPDLPLPASAPSHAEWLKGANILQPYGHSQFVDMVNPGDRPRRLKSELGFNTIIVLPSAAHNALTPQAPMTEAQFREGWEAYRAAGYRRILYTSLMGMGLAPEFQSGQITREHPDWEQRDAKGNPVVVYGIPWLCPSSPAREYTLNYAVRLAQEYHPDGLMLDNNEFFFGPGGWTCHCDYCKKAFREYARQRLGRARTQRLFGVPPEKLEIPNDEGPLFSLWLQWRNRDWAEVNELFRARLRKLNPDLFLFANTQYLSKNGMLASDLQFEHEDVLLSESCNLTSRAMSEKMILGRALAQGRPLWNYIGTFVNASEYTGLRPSEAIAPLIGATLAHDARPWIVDGFDEGKTNAAARRTMAALLGWHAAHSDLSALPPWNPVGVFFSLPSRNVLHRRLMPPNLEALLETGVPVTGIRDDNFTAAEIKPVRVLTMEMSSCLNRRQAGILAKWVRRGGILIAAADTGFYDELGRKRSKSVLWDALEIEGVAGTRVKAGSGQVFIPTAGHFSTEAVNHTEDVSFRTSGEGAEVTPYSANGVLMLQVVAHEPSAKPVTIHLPAEFRPVRETAEWLLPESSTARSLPVVGSDITLTNAPSYSVLKIAVK